MDLKVGDIVCATYGDFNAEKRVGIFLIIYNERQDRRYTNGHSNVNVVKITTNNLLGDSYTVRLRPGDGGLETDCIVNLSKTLVLTKEQCYKKLGTLSGAIMFKVFKELREFNKEIEQQILETI